jgi:hypothetical protein
LGLAVGRNLKRPRDGVGHPHFGSRHVHSASTGEGVALAAVKHEVANRENTRKAASGAALILTEVQLGRDGLLAQGVLRKLAIALRAQIVTASLIYVVTDQIAVDVHGAFKNLMDFQQVVPIIVAFIHAGGIHHCLNFDFYHVPQILDRIEDSLTTIT